MVIIFKSEKALRYLFKYGRVVTYRIKKRKDTNKLVSILPDRGKPSIAKGFVDLICELKENIKPELMNYRKRSGFKTLYEWINEITLLNPTKNPYTEPQYGYLYQVTLPYEDWIELDSDQIMKRIKEKK